MILGGRRKPIKEQLQEKRGALRTSKRKINRDLEQLNRELQALKERAKREARLGKRDDVRNTAIEIVRKQREISECRQEIRDISGVETSIRAHEKQTMLVSVMKTMQDTTITMASSPAAASLLKGQEEYERAQLKNEILQDRIKEMREEHDQEVQLEDEEMLKNPEVDKIFEEIMENNQIIPLEASLPFVPDLTPKTPTLSSSSSIPSTEPASPTLDDLQKRFNALS
jgi:hypothetical protein